MEITIKLIQTWNEFNKTGIDNLFVYVTSINSSFIPTFLFMLALLITLGTYFGTKKFSGQGDFYASLVTGLFLATITSYLMNLKEGFVNLYINAVFTVLFLVSLILLFVTRER